MILTVTDAKPAWSKCVFLYGDADLRFECLWLHIWGSFAIARWLTITYCPILYLAFTTPCSNAAFIYCVVSGFSCVLPNLKPRTHSPHIYYILCMFYGLLILRTDTYKQRFDPKQNDCFLLFQQIPAPSEYSRTSNSFHAEFANKIFFKIRVIHYTFTVDKPEILANFAPPIYLEVIKSHISFCKIS